MANVANALKRKNPRRRLTDKLVRFFVTGGGLLVMFALGLIFFYLAYVVLPLFYQPDIFIDKRFELPVSSAPEQLGFSKNEQFAFRYSKSGEISVFSLADTQDKAIVLKQNVADEPSSFFSPFFNNKLAAYGLKDGTVQFAKLDFIVKNQDEKPVWYPEFEKTDTLSLTDDQAISNLSFTVQNDKRVTAAMADEKLIVVWQKQGKEQARAFISYMQGAKLLLSPDGKTLFALTSEQLDIFALSKKAIAEKKLTLKESIYFDDKDDWQSESLRFMAGGRSVLIEFKPNPKSIYPQDVKKIEQWFSVAGQGKRAFVKAREFILKANDFALERHRNVFASIDLQGEIRLWHTSSQLDDKYDFPSLKGSVDGMAFSISSNKLLIEQQGTFTLLCVDNPHPDVNVRTLWQKIWHEGHSEPDHIWQSSPSHDSLEGKFNIMPLLFGSIKVALYSLFFSVPLALCSAIYTAYFVSAKLRRLIKPTIEMMETLPTVVLGFLASYWLAPIIEHQLVAVGLLLLLLPFSFLLLGLIWVHLPSRWRNCLSHGDFIFILVPFIFLIGYFSFYLGPIIEAHFFMADSRVFITEVIDVNVDKGNIIVLGLAMGFAVIPTIFTFAEDAIYSVPRHLTNGALALGATQWQALTKVVLTTASPGLFSAVMMGLGRAMGESMIVLIVAGNTSLMTWNVFDGVRSLSANIVMEMPESVVGSSHFRVLFLTAFILFSFTFLFNSVAEIIRQKQKEKYRLL